MSKNDSLQVNGDLQTAILAAVKKEIWVGLSVESAFKLFTEGIAAWWPLHSHSVGAEQAESCVFENWIGGRIYEVMQGGKQAEWGRVLVYAPPKRLTFSWYPGRDESTAQEVTITFTADRNGTRLELVHQGWETLGERAQEIRRGYDTGWESVLAEYIKKSKV